MRVCIGHYVYCQTINSATSSLYLRTVFVSVGLQMDAKPITVHSACVSGAGIISSRCQNILSFNPKEIINKSIYIESLNVFCLYRWRIPQRKKRQLFHHLDSYKRPVRVLITNRFVSVPGASEIKFEISPQLARGIHIGVKII